MSGALLAPGPARPLDLLGVGECSLDHVLRVPALPAAGGKALVSAWDERPGGQVATAVLCAVRLGLRAAYAGAVGDDASAQAALSPLVAAGVDLSRVERVRGARTRTAVILVEEGSGERVVLGYRDARLAAAGPALGALALDTTRLVLLDATLPDAAVALAGRARAAGAAVLLDLDTPSAAAERLLDLADFPIVSEGFARSAHGSVEKALAEMARRGARLPVVTLGAHGACALEAGQVLAAAPPRVAVVDTTGAGDAFRGAFAWALIAGCGAAEALRAANAAAALACEGHGAQGALPSAARLRAFLAGAYSSS